MKRIGILSDTHGLLRQEVLDQLQGCDRILHGGDIHNPEILDELERIAPVLAVRGNADKEWAKRLPKKVTCDLFGIQLYMIHNKKEIQEDLSHKDLIVFGHSHKYEERREMGQVWLNPGSWGPRRFRQPVTMAIAEIGDSGTIKIQRIDLLQKDSALQSQELPKNIREIVIQVMRAVDAGKPIEKRDH